MTPYDELIYNTVPGMVRLLPGDKVQLDGGLHIVVKSTESGATCDPLQRRRVERTTADGEKVAFSARGRVQHICGCLPPHLLIERGGEKALEEFKNKNGGKDMITLELGDRLCYRDQQATCVKVYQHKAVLGWLDGREEVVPRRLNEFYFNDCMSHTFLRLDEPQRAANLAEFLARRQPPQGEAQETNSGEKETETVMAKETNKETKKAKTPKPVVSYAGRPEFIAKLIAKGDSDEDIMEAVKVKYPGSSKCNVVKTIEAKRAKAVAAEQGK